MYDAVIIQWTRLGDLLQSRVLLQRIRRAYPAARIALCGDARYSDLVSRFPEHVEYWPINLQMLTGLARHADSQAEFLRVFPQICTQIGNEEIDAVYVLTRSDAAVILAEMLNSRITLGYNRAGGQLFVPDRIQRLLNAREQRNPLPIHLADMWASFFDINSASSWLQAIAATPQKNRIASKGSVSIGIFADAGEAYRSMPELWLGDLVSQLVLDAGTQVTLFGQRIPASVNYIAGVTDRRGQTTLIELINELAAQDLVIGPDTGGLHLAAALGVPTIGLYFGGACAQSTGPYAANAVALQDPLWNHAEAVEIVGLAHEMLMGEQRFSPGALLPFMDQFGIVFRPANATAEQVERIDSRRIDFFGNSSLPQERNATTIPTGSEGKLAAVSIIIPECGVEHYTDELLENMSTELEEIEHEIILVCSGDSCGRNAVSEQGLRVTYVREQEKLSFAEACNRGAGIARNDRLLFLNNDTRFPMGELRKFLSLSIRADISSPQIRYADGVIQNAGVILREGEIVEKNHGFIDVQDVTDVEVDAISAVCMIVARRLFERLGGFDETFVNGYEDLDFCLRAKELGATLKVVDDARVIHYRGSTSGRHNNESHNQRLFAQRWHQTIGKPRSKQSKTSLHRAPLVIISDLPVEAAGCMMRWIWPLEKSGMRLGRDYVWVCAEDSHSDVKAIQDVFSTAGDVVVFRPLSHKRIQEIILESTVGADRPLLVDSDDLVIGRFVQNSHRSAGRIDYENMFRELLMSANAITVSTPYLTSHMAEVGFSATCLPTVPWKQQVGDNHRLSNKEEISIGFMGDASHQLDLGSVLPALEIVLEAYNQVCFYWWGCRPGNLSYHPQVRMGGPFINNYENHLCRLHSFGLDIAVIPLLDTPSARAKSPVKYYEYALAGIPAVYSDVSPYRDIVRNGETGLFASDNTTEWVKSLSRLIESESVRKKIAEEARQDVMSQMNNPEYLRQLKSQLQDKLGIQLPEASRHQVTLDAV